MAFDDALADRIRALLAGDPAVTEKRMFGGLAFLVHGKLAVGASGQGGLMVRVEKAEGEQLLATTAARPMEMRGRPMQGWLRVASSDVDDDQELSAWVARGVGTATRLAAEEG